VLLEISDALTALKVRYKVIHTRFKILVSVVEGMVEPVRLAIQMYATAEDLLIVECRRVKVCLRVHAYDVA